ncbi:MAG: TIGR03808 family TAT-translocated repetitive protein [Bauldia sp.]|nr:TIGR03808 family TAT-translocated repetitive protein [Bauldia sp.]
MNRRQLLAASAAIGTLLPAGAAAQARTGAPVLGTLDAVAFGLQPDTPGDQGAILEAALQAASDADAALFIPPGRYVVSGVTLPDRARLFGVPGASRLVHAGGDHMLAAYGSTIVRLADLVIDGANAPLGEWVPGIVHLNDAPDVAIEGCEFVDSAKSGIALDRCGGRIAGNRILRAADAGIRAIESTGLSVSDNLVADCGNAGILVYRWEAGEDGSIVSGNRVERIAANDGGTGQNGNGINVFRAHNVIVSGNRIADCAFTAIRANSADNVQIVGNNCLRMGEVGIYSEFVFEATLIANNIVDAAATGISVANFLDGGRMAVVSGNIVRNLTGSGPYEADPPGFGIGIAIEADVALSGNLIDGAPLFGVLLGWGPYLRDVAATGNVIRRAPIGFAVTVVEGGGPVLIASNVISGATDGAVVGYRWAERTTGDLARDATAFPQLTIAGNRIA